jgi:hypothetical protein
LKAPRAISAQTQTKPGNRADIAQDIYTIEQHYPVAGTPKAIPATGYCSSAMKKV